jgi:opacity protein-like surface antigen
MLRKFSAALLLFLTPLDAGAFYMGMSGGRSKATMDGASGGRDSAYSIYGGTYVPFPVFSLRTELEYSNMKSDFSNPSPTVAKSGFTTRGFSANTYLGIPFISYVKPYVGVGIGLFRQENEVAFADSTYGSFSSENRIAPQYMVGFDIDIPNSPVGFGLEYRHAEIDFEYSGRPRVENRISATYAKFGLRL